MTPTDFAKISMTAKLTAYMRHFSDIPYAQDVVQHIQAIEAVDALLTETDLVLDDVAWYAPMLEIRYKTLVSLIRQQGIDQVLELASGYSLRGLAMTQNPDFNPPLTYIETDLEGLTAEKRTFVAELAKTYGFTHPANHHMRVANAMEASALKQAADVFQPDKPIIVLNEGLLQYLSTAELDTVTTNVVELLRLYGGVWMTPDFSLKEQMRHIPPKQARFRDALNQKTHRPMFANAFDSHDHLEAYFKQFGLTCKRLNQVDIVSKLTSEKRLDFMAKLAWHAIKPKLSVWVLSVD